MPTRMTPIWLQLAALVAATPLLAQHAAVQTSSTTRSAAGAIGEAAQKVAVDPQDGQLRDLTPEEARALVSSLTRSLAESDAGLVKTVLPSGAVKVDLKGRFESATLAKVGPDGTVASECVTTIEDAKRFLADAPVEAPAETPALEEK
jgi:hypothetical protein